MRLNSVLYFFGMTQRFLWLVLVFWAGTGAAIRAQSLGGPGDLSLVQSWPQEPDGWSYPVAVSIPSVAVPAQGFPVGILLHGNGGNGPSMFSLGNDLLTDHILVAPTGYLNSWNLCGENSEAPDIAMLTELVGQLSGFDNVDASHIRLIGFSNGAGLVNQAFIELDDLGIDALVAFVSQMNEPQYHEGEFHRPSGTTDAPQPYCGYNEVAVPVLGRRYLSICNDNDPVIPYGGGPAVGNVFLPAEVAIHQVAVQQGHVGPPVTGVSDDAAEVTVFSYLDGDVVLVRGGAGHGTTEAQLEWATEFLALDAPEDPPVTDCPEDLDLDGLVSVGDLLMLLGEFGCTVDCGPPDINGDGLVGVSDVLAMLNVFGTPCLAVPEVPEVMEAATYAVDVESGIVYAEGLSHDTLNSATATAMPLLLDAYVPENAGPNRPAMVLIHGGGFFGGSRTALSMVNLAQYFASRGWVVFSIDYRLASDMGTVPQAWVDSLSGLSVELGSLNQSLAIYPAHRDAKAALRWVVSHAEDYEINTDYLTVGGGSAGAITSIGVGVTESEDFTEELTVDEDPTLLTTHLGVDFEVQTILDFWGSRISVSILEGSYGVERFDPSDPPLCIFHGTEDPTVLYFNALVLQATYENTGVPYVLHTLEGAGHGPWGANIDGVGLPALAFNFMVAQQALTVQ